MRAPLDAAEVDVAVERGDDADDIDIRGKRLRLGAAGNRRPHDRGSSWDEVDDRSVGDRHPVTGAQVEPAGTHAQLVAGCNGVADAAIDAGYARRGGVVCEALGAAHACRAERSTRQREGSQALGFENGTSAGDGSPALGGQGSDDARARAVSANSVP